MTAKDYKICPSLFNCYIARVSKTKPDRMLRDRRALKENEIFDIVAWYLKKHCIMHNTDSVTISTSKGKLFTLKAEEALIKEIEEGE